MPNPTPIFLRKSLGGVPPAKIQTKSLAISRRAHLTSRMTLPCLNSTGFELNTTSTLPASIQSCTRFALRSLMRLKHSCRYDSVTLLPLWYRSEEHTSELQSPMYLVCRLL